MVVVVFSCVLVLRSVCYLLQPACVASPPCAVAPFVARVATRHTPFFFRVATCRPAHVPPSFSCAMDGTQADNATCVACYLIVTLDP